MSIMNEQTIGASEISANTARILIKAFACLCLYNSLLWKIQSTELGLGSPAKYDFRLAYFMINVHI